MLQSTAYKPNYDLMNGFDERNVYPHKLITQKSIISNWRTRLLCEFHTAPQSFNIRLSFDDEHLPLDIKDIKAILQKFWKRVRRYYSYHSNRKITIKYFQISEYGEKNTCRLHLHVMCFVYGGVDYWDFVNVIEDKWYEGQTHTRSMSSEHVFYNTKYILKKLFDPSYRSQSQGLGLDYTLKLSEYLINNDFKFVVCGYNRIATRYQKEKILSIEQLEDERNKYVEYLQDTFEEAPSQDVVMTPFGLQRALKFLATFFCINSWSPEFLLTHSAFEIVGTQHVGNSKRGYNLPVVRWYGCYARYFGKQLMAREEYVKLKSKI